MKWIKRILGSRRFRWFSGISIVFIAAAVTVAAIGPGDVETVPVDPASAIGAFLEGSGYSDSYRMVVPNVDPEDPAFLDAIAFQRGKLVSKASGEVVYEGPAPGLVFYVSYDLRKAGPNETAVRMTTIVHYTSRKGRMYFFFVRPVHRLLAPWGVRYFVRQAVAATAGK